MNPGGIIILITGPSCTGKTTLANALAQRFGLLLFAKDRFKEMMYDVARPAGDYSDLDLDVSRVLGKMSIRCLEIILEQICRSGSSAIFEANFDGKLFSPVLAQCRRDRNVHVVQINLTCRGDVLLERFIRREETTRHRGHGGLRHLEALKATLLRGSIDPVEQEITDDLLTLDTTDLDHVDYAPVYNVLAGYLGAR